jgi:hypothetical protein
MECERENVAEESELKMFDCGDYLSWDADFIPPASIVAAITSVVCRPFVLGYDNTRSRTQSVEVTRRLDDENARHVLCGCRRYR